MSGVRNPGTQDKRPSWPRPNKPRPASTSLLPSRTRPASTSSVSQSCIARPPRPLGKDERWVATLNAHARTGRARVRTLPGTRSTTRMTGPRAKRHPSDHTFLTDNTGAWFCHPAWLGTVQTQPDGWTYDHTHYGMGITTRSQLPPKPAKSYALGPTTRGRGNEATT